MAALVDRRPRRLGMLAAAVLAWAAVLVPASAAEAAPPQCVGGQCDGKGPVSNNCDDTGGRIASASVEVPAAGGPNGVVQLMFSTGCRAYWARGNSLRTGSNPVSADFDVRIIKRNTATDALIYRHTQTVPDNMDGPLGEYWDWTQMAGSSPGTKVRACAIHRDKTACTAWFHTL